MKIIPATSTEQLRHVRQLFAAYSLTSLRGWHCRRGSRVETMTPLYQDPHFTFHFADDRLIPRFHLHGIEARRRVSVFKIDPGTGQRLGLLATATVGDDGWVDLTEPIIVQAGEAFIAVPE